MKKKVKSGRQKLALKKTTIVLLQPAQLVSVEGAGPVSAGCVGITDDCPKY